MLKCMDCGTEGVSGIHGCNWTGKDSPVTRAEFDALVQRVAALEGQPAVSEKNRVSDPPAAPSLLPCPFCGYAKPCCVHTRSPLVQCLQCGATSLDSTAWNRRAPADASLRELAACYLEHSRLEERCTCQEALTSYLRETAR